MASPTNTPVSSFVARLASRLWTTPNRLPTTSNSSTLLASVSSGSSHALPVVKSKCFGFGEIFSGPDLNSFGGSALYKAEFSIAPFWKLDFSSRLRGRGGQNVPQSMAGKLLAGGQHVRTIMVEVKGNDLERALRKWRRKCKEENLKILKEREYFKKPSEKRVLALKERDRRIAKRSFKAKLNWIMSRRQRGF